MAFDLFQTLGLQSKRPDVTEHDPYAQVRPLLRQYAEQGMPELIGQTQGVFQDELLPDVRALYEGRRGLGVGSTPEVVAGQRAARGLSRDLAQQQAQIRMNALGAFGRTPTQFSSTPVATGGQNLMSLLAPLGGQFLGSGGLQDVFGLNKNKATDEVTPDEDIASRLLGLGATGLGFAAGGPVGAQIGAQVGNFTTPFLNQYLKDRSN